MKVHAKQISTQLLVIFLSAALAFEPLALAQESMQSQPLPTDSPTQARHVFTQQELDQMLAPIALYPDSLMSQILMASTYPLEVVQAARWSRANPNLKGEEAVRAVAENNWDPSVKSLVAFPQILMMMDEKLDWTERLGGAFLSQESQVLDTVQNLRQKAYAAGNLKSNDQVRVQPEGQTIIVEPANPQVVYVPYYDPWVVYGPWWWPTYPPVYWAPWPGYYVRPGFGAGFVWGVGVTLGVGFFFGAFDWHRRHVTVVNVNNYYYNRVRLNHVGVWEHDPGHRRGVPYRDELLRQRFGRTSVTPEARRDFRGFDRRDIERRHEFGNRPDLRGSSAGRSEQRAVAGAPAVRPNTDLRGGSESNNNSGGFRARPDRDIRGETGNRRGELNGRGGGSNEGGRSEGRPPAFEGVGRGADVRSSSERGHASSAPQSSGNFRGGDGRSHRDR